MILLKFLLIIRNSFEKMQEYFFQIGNRTSPEYTPFSVVEAAKAFPKMNFGRQSWINEKQYRKLHAVSLAATLQELGSGFFGGRGGHVVYPFEYAQSHADSNVNRVLSSKIAGIERDRSEAHILEIGGQQGGFMAEFLKNTPATIKATILDLDLTRRRRESYPDWTKVLSSGKKSLRYVQGDAQRLTENADKWGIPLQDLVVMSNVTHVMFDPLGVLAQAWDHIRPGGGLLLSHLVSLPELPIWLETKDEQLAKKMAETFGLRPGGYYRTYNDLLAWRKEWKKSQDHFLRSIPPGQFKYSSDRDRESLAIKSIVKAYENLPTMYPLFNIGLIARQLGQEVEMHKAMSERNEKHSYIWIKKNSVRNPFNDFQIMGVGQAVTMDNVILPQIYRSITM